MTSPPIFPPSFLLLQQEGYLISSCLATGLSELRRANVHNKGAFYAALLNISVGLERLMKAIIIMDHMIMNQLAVPSRKKLKEYGHDIVSLYDSCVSISAAENSKLTPIQNLEPISAEILALLNDFAQTTRYHNLDALSGLQTQIDPLEHWNNVMMSILRKDVSKTKRDRILSQANAASNALAGKAFTLMQGLDKQALTTEQALALPGLHDQAARYAVLYIIKMLTELRDLTSDISHKAYACENREPPFPQMQEFLEWVWDDRAYVLRKKKWP